MSAQDLFLFFDKSLFKVMISGQHLSFNTFCAVPIGHTKKITCIKLQFVDPEIFSTNFCL